MKGDASGRRFRFGAGHKGKTHAPGVRLGNAPSKPYGNAYAKGGVVKDKNWIAGAIKKPGALHRQLGVPQGEKIPAKKLAKASQSDNPTLRKRAALAKTLKSFGK